MQEGKMKMRGLANRRRRTAAFLAIIAVAGGLAVVPAMALDASPVNSAPKLMDSAEPSGWSSAPHMIFEREFAGPVTDTIIRRWRDPDNGAQCYIYAPISAKVAGLAAAGPAGYKADAIGSISCIPGTAAPVSSVSNSVASANPNPQGFGLGPGRGPELRLALDARLSVVGICCICARLLRKCFPNQETPGLGAERGTGSSRSALLGSLGPLRGRRPPCGNRYREDSRLRLPGR